MVRRLGFALFVGALTSQAAYGFVLLGGPSEAALDVSEESPTVDFILDLSPPSISDKDQFLDGRYRDLGEDAFWQALVQEAFDQWNKVYGSFLVMQISETLPQIVNDDGDGRNTIAVAPTNYSAAAFALPVIEEDKITECDITIGTKKTSADDMAYTLMHEIGHCVGLGHNHSNYDAVMGYSRDDRRLRLGADDKAGIIYLYPDSRAGADKVVEEVGCGTIGSRRSAGALLLIFFLPLFLISRKVFNHGP